MIVLVAVMLSTSVCFAISGNASIAFLSTDVHVAKQFAVFSSVILHTVTLSKEFFSKILQNRSVT